MWPFLICIDALVQDTAAKIKICRYSYAPFLKSTSISGPSAQNSISEIYDLRTVYPKGFIPKVFLSWDNFKAWIESPSAEPQLPVIPKYSFCHQAFHYCAKQMLWQMGE